MPEIKNSFVQGKMNKDLDERLIQNGQYRDALNIEVSTSEGSNVGTAQNILGNFRVEDKVDNSFICVGTVGDEKTNKIYWFISKYEIDAIVEYDIDNDITRPVLVDTNAGNFKAVLKFSGNIITGINLINGLLFWTDNNSDPKKINVEECKKGTTVDALQLLNHTQLLFENGSFNGVTVELTTKYPGDNVSTGFTATTRANFGRYVWYEEKQLKAMLGVETIAHGDTFNVRHYRNNKFLGLVNILVGVDSNGFFIKDNVNFDNNNQLFLDVFYIGDVLFGDNVTLNIEERHITVIKPNPLNALSVKINHSYNVDSTSNIPNLFETKFPRFSYRYKYRDGEYSAFAPFTTPVFNPKYTKDTSNSVDSNSFINKDNAYDIKEPYNKAMVNSIHSIDLSDFITAKTPENVIEIDLLYKQEESSVIYSIDTIRHYDEDWHKISNHEGLGLELGIGKSPNASGSYQAIGGYTKGKYKVTTENIYAALPENQLLRPWDNVPRKALAQEVTGNRIVYGNYVQGYDLIEKPEVSVSYSNRKNNLKSFTSQGLPSVKSQRNYQLGVIYCDKFGRETPVLTSKAGAVNIPWQDASGQKNASRSLQLNSSVNTNFPSWVDSLKFFIKETSNPYYNMTMDRAWVTKSTYELDNSEGHLWMSFPSSDRNKVSEEDYIILKKKIGVGEEQVSFENKYKIIDIKNEAPDAIKYQLINIGVKGQGGSDNDLADGNTTTKLLYSKANRIDKQVDTIILNHSRWMYQGAGGYVGKLEEVHDSHSTTSDSKGDPIKKDLYLSWSREGTDNSVSKKYKVTSGWVGSVGYVLKLSTPITKIDADIAHRTGDSATDEDRLHTDLSFQVEQRVIKDSEDFSGKFFVKISKNQITDIVESGSIVDIQDQYQLFAKASSMYWQDDKIDAFSPSIVEGHSGYGLTNWNGVDNNHSAGNAESIHNIVATGGSAVNVAGHSVGNQALRLVDYSNHWDGILTAKGPRFFIDGMFMRAGQSDASDYAKYSCVTWSGCTKGDNGDTLENSAWSYPPLKTWISDFGNISNMITPESYSVYNNVSTVIPASSVWYENNLISTSPVLSANADFEGLQVDGWVGPLQNVSRDEADTLGINSDNHINGLEGLVTTISNHATGPRRWFSGMNGTETGVGVDTKTYSDNEEIGNHFMHLSFFAPGKDLHSGDFSNVPTSGQSLYGPSSWAANLEGIWGGGVFTGEYTGQLYGSETPDEDKHLHLAMEGNHDANNNVVMQTPGPGVGYGYDLKYRELHDRQWDPTFNKDGDDNNVIRDFIRNLHSGSKFRFNKVGGDLDDVVYTIKKVHIKKLYNHTSWRKPYNKWSIDGAASNIGYDSDQDLVHQSVEEVGLTWLDQLDDDGIGLNSNSENVNFGTKIEQFGKAHNRRLCYIIELDRSPTNNHGSIGNVIGNGNNLMDATEFTDIEFLDPVKDKFLSDLSKFPAIWEVDPKKSDVNLDIYYEATGSLPVKINESTNELFAPIGCKVEILNSSIVGTSIVESWSNTIATLSPGLPKGDGGGNEINYAGMSFKFIREDGSYTIAEAGQQNLDGVDTGLKNTFNFREDIGDVITSGLNWYNCFSFGNGIESNRIKDDFNETFITNGVKASTTTLEPYKEERRKTGLIYSGIYNSNSGINNLNQFIMAEKITKDLNPTYGSIQKLFQRRISLIAFCEDKVVQITSNKDAIYNADGNPQLISTNNVLGDANPFEGNFGISKNPESFASESYRAYFTDKQRGSVIRLSKDGLTPISKAGMSNWFKDNLSQYNTLLGTYDSDKQDYNITLTNNTNFNENLLLDSRLEAGTAYNEIEIGTQNTIVNPGVFSGNSQRYLHDNDDYDILNYSQVTNPFNWSSFAQSDYNLTGNLQITHHKKIDYEDLLDRVQAEAQIGTASNPTGTYTATVTLGDGTEFSYTGSTEVEALANAEAAYPNATFTVSSFVAAQYAGTSVLLDGGWWYDPGSNGGFMSVGGDIFGGSAVTNSDGQVNSSIKRVILDTEITESNNISWDDSSGVSGNPSVDNEIQYYANNYDVPSKCITRNDGTHDGTDGAIVFDRVDPGASSQLNTYVKFQNIGSGGNPAAQGINTNFVQNGGTVASGNIEHDSFFNGDELHIQFEIMCFPTFDGNNASERRRGYNYITPTLELWDGDNFLLGSNYFCSPSSGTTSDYENINTSQTDMGGEFENVETTVDEFFGSSDAPSMPVKSYEDSYRHIVNSSVGSTTSLQHYACIKGTPSTSGKVVFPTTYGNSNSSNFNVLPKPGSYSVNFHNVNVAYGWRDHTPLGSWYPGNNYENDPVKLRLGATFKFRDHNQQNADGSPINAGDDISAVKVVNDLRIRIGNIRGASTNSMYNAYTADGGNSYPLKRPLWELHKLFCKKGFGITHPSEDEETDTATTSNAAQTYPGYTPAVVGVDAVPPYDVPAWTEITHSGNYGFSGTNAWGLSNDNDSNINSEQQDILVFGGNHSSVSQTSENITYVVPSDWYALSNISNATVDQENKTLYNSTLTTANDALVSSPWDSNFSHSNSSFNLFGDVFDRNINNTYNHNAPGAYKEYNNNYMQIVCVNNTASAFIDVDLTDAWVDGEWYLVDVEWDENYGAGATAGQSPTSPPAPDGALFINNVITSVDYNQLGIVDLDGVGTFRGGIGNPKLQLQKVLRTEYGNPQDVLRGIFKVDANHSNFNASQFKMQLYGCSLGMRIKKIIVKKLSNSTIWTNWLNTNGIPTDWIPTSPVATQPVHSFDTQYIYYSSPALCFEFPDGTSEYSWEQDFNVTGAATPTESSLEWELKFRVDDLPNGTLVNGSLDGFVTG